MSKRRAKVCVGGKSSSSFEMSNMVYQGTILWNLFFADAEQVFEDSSEDMICYADDLNAWATISNNEDDEIDFAKLQVMQLNLHSWGENNSIAFDASKESKTIVLRFRPAGTSFRILDVLFDPTLIMHECVHETVVSCNWKIRTLLRCRAYYSIPEIINLYKSHVLSFIEYRSPVLIHASNSVLLPLDLVQNRFLSQLGVSVEYAACEFRLLPLRVRRHIACLGVIHRAILRKGPPHFWHWFVLDTAQRLSSSRRHRRCLKEICAATSPDYLKRSLVGMIKIYNMLPEWAISICSVKEFQSALQKLVISQVGRYGWIYLFDPKHSFIDHPLRRIF